MKFAKYVLPVVVGTMAAMMLISLGEWVTHTVYPLPGGTDVNNKAMLMQAIANMPAGAFAVLLINYIICSFAGGAIATLVGGRSDNRPAIIVGILLTLAGIFNTFSLPHPAWFMVNIAMYLPFSYAGFLVGRKR